MAKQIPLTQGQFAIVDDEDFERLNQHKWYFNQGYAVHCVGKRPNYKQILMHREIMKPLPGFQIDHINHKKLDNRRINLRICNNSENSRNRAHLQKSSSKYKGVTWHKKDKRWIAQIKICGKQKRIGAFKDEAKAARAYNKKAIELFGKFARLNNDI